MISILKPTNSGMETIARINEEDLDRIDLARTYGWNIVFVNENGLVSTLHDSEWSERPLVLYSAINSIKERTVDYKLASETLLTLIALLQESNVAWVFIHDYKTATFIEDIFYEKGYYVEVRTVDGPFDSNPITFKLLVVK